MKRELILPLILGLYACAEPACAGSCSGRHKKDGNKPNVIFILADDLGGMELSCYGNSFNETPVLDSIARLGIQFTSGYASAPISSPSRAGLLSGQYPCRLGITDYIKPKSSIHMDTSLVALPEALRRNGYRTCIIGKLHLSGYLDNGASIETRYSDYGFDEAVLNADRSIGQGTYFYPYDHLDDVEPVMAGEHEFLVDRMNHEAVEYIERNADRPFFLYLSHYAVHKVVHGQPEIVDHFRAKPECGHSPAIHNDSNDPYTKWPEDCNANHNNPHQAAQLVVMDSGVREILDKLHELGIADNTIIIFTGDNGGATSVTDNGVLRDGKGSLYEGGTRGPLIIYQPGRADRKKSSSRGVSGRRQAVKGGRVTDMPVNNYDFYPTICELTGTSLPEGQQMDGVSIASYLRGGKEITGRPLFWYFKVQERRSGGKWAASVRLDNWKLIHFLKEDRYELYDLSSDIGETDDRYTSEQATAARLKLLLDDWVAETVVSPIRKQ